MEKDDNQEPVDNIGAEKKQWITPTMEPLEIDQQGGNGADDNAETGS